MEDYTLIPKSTSSNVVTLFLTTLLLITFVTAPISAATTSTPTSSIKAYKKFIKISCAPTTNATLCYNTLAPYASTIKTDTLILCDVALAVTINAANHTALTVTKLVKQKKGMTVKESGVIKDCLENLKDTISRLQDCLKAMSNLSGPQKKFELDNAKTWASAAITDEGTCWDELSESKVDPDVKEKIRTNIQKTDQLNSNALYFINHLNY